MDDRQLLDCIRALVAEEHWLREQRDEGRLCEDVEIRRLSEVENSLDQLWNLLRQRRAMRAAGLNPDVVEPHPHLPVEVNRR